MKQTLLLFFVFFAGYGLFSQNFVIEFKGENVILAGVPQKLDVLPMNASVGKLSYSMTNGTVAETDSGIYIKSMKLGSAVLSIKSGSKVYRTITYSVKKLPVPTASVAGSTGGKISKKTLTSAQKLDAFSDILGIQVPSTVTSFDVTAKISGSYITEKSNGAYFTARQKGIINKMNRNDRIFIENVRALMPDGTPVKLNDIVIN